ncbi:hypothetical protein ACWER6_11980 [Streptomyces sp. NPDC004009]
MLDSAFLLRPVLREGRRDLVEGFGLWKVVPAVGLLLDPPHEQSCRVSQFAGHGLGCLPTQDVGDSLTTLSSKQSADGSLITWFFRAMKVLYKAVATPFV